MIAVNPGADPIEQPHSPEAAARNIERFVIDLTERGVTIDSWRPLGWDEITSDSLIMGGTWSYGGPCYEGEDGKLVIPPARHDGPHDGRYAFYVNGHGQRHLVEMPGLALDAVRYMRDGQRPSNFPRLYIDGSSWLWLFGLSLLAREFLDKALDKHGEES